MNAKLREQFRIHVSCILKEGSREGEKERDSCFFVVVCLVFTSNQVHNTAC